jgi:3-deoxy-D-manno-octulosonic-acid transferase
VRFLDTIRALPSDDVQWLLVPRHPQRFDEVAELARRRGFSVSRRREWLAGPRRAEVWIGDSLGEMPLYYGMADAALLGGSFEPLGGQNLIEAAACGCPVVMGPHTFNFAEAAQLAHEASAAARVADMEEGVRTALAIVADGARREAMSQAGLQFAAAHQGAAQRMADAVLALVTRRS